MRVGLIGLGRIGSIHATTLSGLAAVDSLVVTDAAPSVVAATVERTGAEPVHSVDDLLAAGVDGVVVAAPTDAHPDLVLRVVDAGLPVFCEKPVARTADEAVAVRDRVRGAVAQVGYPRRFDEGFVAAREAVRGGRLGRLHTVRSTTLDPAPPPEAYIATSGGIFADCGVHDLDAVRWVTGQEVVEVYATGTNQGEAFFAEHGDVDTAAATLRLDGGTLALVSNTRYNAAGYDVRLEVHGALDSIAAGLDDGLPLRSVEPGVSFPAGPAHTFFIDRFARAFRAELTAFTEVIAGARPSPCTIEDAVESSLVAEACALSMRERRPVAMTEVRR